MKKIALVFSLGLVALASQVQADASMLQADVINAETEDGKGLITINRGIADGVMPGAAGWMRDANGKKSPGTDFEIYKVTEKGAFARVNFTAYQVSHQQNGASLSVSVASTATCSTKGTKPDFTPKDVALGQKAPAGYTFATVITAREYGDTKVAFTIDKGWDDAILPTSQAYVPMPGLGTPAPYTVDITWVTKNSAGGYVKVMNPAKDKDLIRKMGIEIGSCKKK